MTGVPALCLPIPATHVIEKLERSSVELGI